MRYKIKSKSGSKKRFKITFKGKIKRKHAFKNHILTKKTNKQKRKLNNLTLVSKADLKKIQKQLLIK